MFDQVKKLMEMKKQADILKKELEGHDYRGPGDPRHQGGCQWGADIPVH